MKITPIIDKANIHFMKFDFIIDHLPRHSFLLKTGGDRTRTCDPLIMIQLL